MKLEQKREIDAILKDFSDDAEVESENKEKEKDPPLEKKPPNESNQKTQRSHLLQNIVKEVAASKAKPISVVETQHAEDEYEQEENVEVEKENGNEQPRKEKEKSGMMERIGIPTQAYEDLFIALSEEGHAERLNPEREHGQRSMTQLFATKVRLPLYLCQRCLGVDIVVPLGATTVPKPIIHS